MANAPMLEPGDLTKEELLEIVERVRDAVWPQGGRAKYTAKMATEVASILDQWHLSPYGAG